MSLEKILQTLEANIAQVIAEIEQETQAEIESIGQRAQVKAKEVQQAHITRIQTPLRVEKARILNRAKLEALQVVLGAREALITSVLEEATRVLAALSNSKQYEQVLATLTREGVETLGIEGQIRLRVRGCDAPLMRRVVKSMGLPATIEEGLDNESPTGDCLGGVIISTPDGSISMDNTLGTRLERAGSFYRPKIAEMLRGTAPEG